MRASTMVSGWVPTALLAGILMWAAPAAAAVLTVTTAADNETDDTDCTFREAIRAANGTPANPDCGTGDAGLDTIAFDIGAVASTVHVITLGSLLPIITQPVTVDGYSQKAGQPGGAAPNTLATGSNAVLRIAVRGDGGGFNCLQLGPGSDGSHLRGLSIAQCAVAIGLGGASQVTVAGTFLGTDAAGTAAGPGNAVGISISASGAGAVASSNVIGGPAPADRNVISANSDKAVRIDTNAGGVANGNRILGNLIGTTATGSAPLGNANGAIALAGASGTQIGGADGTTPGGPCTGACNVIAATGMGIGVNVGTGPGSLVAGNFIGTNAAGTTSTGFGNNTGIVVGPAAAGLPSIIGGPTLNHRNVIAGNGGGIGVATPGGIVSPHILGNFIGTNAAGTGALPNTTGINVTGVSGVTIGGPEPGAGNVISGNIGLGIVLNNAAGATIQGNLIGTAVDGLSSLGNGAAGIRLAGAATVGTTIGPAQSGGPGGNVIAFNAQEGVFVAAQTANRILGNAIFGNGSRAIELGALGAEAIDACDPDGGVNNGQNPPILAQALALPGGVVVSGSLTSTAGGTFTLEFFRNPPGDPAQARTFLGGTAVTTGGSPGCAAAFEVALSTPGAVGDTITATATSTGGDTSEVSAPVTAVFQPIIIGGPGGSPDPVASLAAVQLGVEVADVVAAPTFQWSADCPGGVTDGVLSDPAAAAPTFNAPRVTTRGGTAGCTITVVVGDGLGGSETASYVQTVVPPARSARVAGPAGSSASRATVPLVAPAAPGLAWHRAGSPGPGAAAPWLSASETGGRLILGTGPGEPPRIRLVDATSTALVLDEPVADAGARGGVRLATCDLDGDGQGEILTTAGPGDLPALRMWRIEAGPDGEPALRLDAERLVAAPEAAGGVYVACGDLDGTGSVILVSGAADDETMCLGVFRLTGRGLEAVADVVGPGPAPGGAPVAVADLDGDGRAEVLVGAGPGARSVVLVLDGPALLTGLWNERARWAAAGADRGTAVGVAGGDLDGDGRAEVAVATTEGGDLVVRVLDGMTLADRTAVVSYDPFVMQGVALPLVPAPAVAGPAPAR